jgi:hypothetical protein
MLGFSAPASSGRGRSSPVLWTWTLKTIVLQVSAQVVENTRDHLCSILPLRIKSFSIPTPHKTIIPGPGVLSHPIHSSHGSFTCCSLPPPLECFNMSDLLRETLAGQLIRFPLETKHSNTQKKSKMRKIFTAPPPTHLRMA